MKSRLLLVGTVAVAVGFGALTARAEDPQLLRGKVELLVGQVADLHKDSFRKGSEVYGASYQYYYSLMYATGTNLLARSESQTNLGLLRKYVDLVTRDYEAYDKVTAATQMAGATGKSKGNAGTRHRAKRLINAEKMGDRELAEAIRRWERFVGEVKRSSPKR